MSLIHNGIAEWGWIDCSVEPCARVLSPYWLRIAIGGGSHIDLTRACAHRSHTRTRLQANAVKRVSAVRHSTGQLKTSRRESAVGIKKVKSHLTLPVMVAPCSVESQQIWS